MRDLIEMTYKCTTTTSCYKCEYMKECFICEIIYTRTGNTLSLIDYPTPTQIIYA